MNIPFRVKKLTTTAKLPEQANMGDLYDLFADDFDTSFVKDMHNDGGDANYYDKNITIHDDQANDYNLPLELTTFNIGTWREKEGFKIMPQGRILVKTGIALELPVCVFPGHYDIPLDEQENEWVYKYEPYMELEYFAVADLRPRSGLALKHGITVLNAPATIDNSYRKEIGVILYNAGHEPYTIKKGDKIAQMLIRPLYPSKMEVVEEIEDTARGGYGSTGK